MIKSSLRAQRSNPFFLPALAWIAASLMLLVMTGKAHAQETYEYSPAPCEFTVSFPEEPSPERRCDQNGGRCYDVLNYTQVFDLAATVNFRVICNAADKAMLDYYTPEIMERTLEAMKGRATVQVSEYDTTARATDEYRQAGLVGEGEIGGQPTIYLAQLWVGKESIFSIEGEIIGETHQKADELFRDILASVNAKADKKEEAEEPAAEKTKEN